MPDHETPTEPEPVPAWRLTDDLTPEAELEVRSARLAGIVAKLEQDEVAS